MANEFITNHQTETFKSLITISLDIFKGLILINGGAAAGMVATLDKLTKVIPIGAVQASMGFFVGGLLAAVVASSCAYFTQLALHEENMGREARGNHRKWVIAVTIFCISSMVCFGVGGLVAALSIRPAPCP